MKFLFRSFVPVICLILAPACAYGGSNTPSKYEITVQSIEVSKDGGGTFIPVNTQNAVFDIASAQSSQAIGAYASGVDLEDGVYNAVRVVISNTITVNGNALNSGNGLTYCTRSNGNPISAGCPGAEEDQAITILAGFGFPAGVTLDAANSRIVILDQSVSLAVDRTKGKAFRISFDISAGINVSNVPGNNTMFPGPPVVTIT